MSNKMPSGGFSLPINVLIVDNSAAFCEWLALVLRSDARTRIVGVAENGKEALTRLFETDVDLMFLDLIMPQMDGLTLLQRLYQADKHPRPHIIVLTAYNDSRVVQTLAQYSEVSCIMKPCSGSTILASLNHFSQTSTPARSVLPPIAMREDNRPRDMIVTQYLRALGIRSSMAGFRYLCTAIHLAASQPDFIHAGLTDLCKKVASIHRTTPIRIEVAIRRAIYTGYACQPIHPDITSLATSVDAVPIPWAPMILKIIRDGAAKVHQI